jgi:pilus assembly protein CpaD
MTTRIPVDRYRALRVAGALVGLAGLTVMLGACTHTADQVATASIPEDYRLRHPIAVQEANQSVVILVGHARGGLSADQRADVIGLARTWRHDATGPITADVPIDNLHRYHPADPRQMAAIRLNYPRMTAVVGPCGLWPEDLGPSIHDKSYLDNKSWYNLGCANQRNMAAMVDNPADLVQPRSETPAYTARRSEGFEKYRKGNTTTTLYPEADKAKLSDTGK